jgi:hypothetical protein
MHKTEDEIEGIIEAGLGELFRGFYRLRESGQYQREYDTVETIITMLSEYRQYIRENYKVDE